MQEGLNLQENQKLKGRRSQTSQVSIYCLLTLAGLHVCQGADKGRQLNSIWLFTQECTAPTLLLFLEGNSPNAIVLLTEKTNLIRNKTQEPLYTEDGSCFKEEVFSRNTETTTLFCICSYHPSCQTCLEEFFTSSHLVCCDKLKKLFIMPFSSPFSRG